MRSSEPRRRSSDEDLGRLLQEVEYFRTEVVRLGDEQKDSLIRIEGVAMARMAEVEAKVDDLGLAVATLTGEIKGGKAVIALLAAGISGLAVYFKDHLIGVLHK